MSENEPERAQTGLQKGHSRDATVPLSAFKCGSFASPESPEGKITGLFRCLKAAFPFWLGIFVGSVFVDIIRHHPASYEATLSQTTNEKPSMFQEGYVKTKMVATQSY